MDDRSEGSPAEARQRWRIVFRRDPDASIEARPETVETWTAALSGAGLPVASSQGKAPRLRIALAMPLPAGVAGEAESIDVVLTERLTRADVRGRLEGHVPAGDRLVDLFDVWLGEPTLASRLAAADYRFEIGAATGDELDQACAGLLAASSLPRSRPKGDGRVVDYDLRSLLLGVEVSREANAPLGVVATGRQPTDAVTVLMRLRVSQEGASGRPDEVVLALGEAVGRPLVVERTVRQRLLTVDDLATMSARG